MCQIIDSWSQPGACQRVNSCAVERKGNQAQVQRRIKPRQVRTESAEDIELWEEKGRDDILEWVDAIQINPNFLTPCGLYCDITTIPH